MAGYSPAIYAFVRWAVKTFYFGTHGGLRTMNHGNVPASGGVLLAPNHVSHLDPPAACCALHRPVHCMAKEELFKNKLFGWLITALAAFPVKRGEGDTESIRTAMALLEAGEVVLLFPEGTRGDGTTLQPISRGVALLAKRTGVPVVPVGITGTHLVMPRDKSTKARKHAMIVACGRPFTYQEIATSSSEKENREIFARTLQERILEMCRENGLPLKIGAETRSQTESSAPERGSVEPTV
ncbi:MAG: lysophospholipid acyltransferase family protein [Fimbriimonas sp.]